jgi:hypothetical protein
VHREEAGVPESWDRRVELRKVLVEEAAGRVSVSDGKRGAADALDLRCFGLEGYEDVGAGRPADRSLLVPPQHHGDDRRGASADSFDLKLAQFRRGWAPRSTEGSDFEPHGSLSKKEAKWDERRPRWNGQLAWFTTCKERHATHTSMRWRPCT